MKIIRYAFRLVSLSSIFECGCSYSVEPFCESALLDKGLFLGSYLTAVDQQCSASVISRPLSEVSVPQKILVIEFQFFQARPGYASQF